MIDRERDFITEDPLPVRLVFHHHPEMNLDKLVPLVCHRTEHWWIDLTAGAVCRRCGSRREPLAAKVMAFGR